jgi:hypothetical protein
MVPGPHWYTFHFEGLPAITDADGKPIPIASVAMEGLRKENVVDLAAGEVIDFCELKLDLRPASESGKKGHRTLYGMGKFQIQYEQVTGEYLKPVLIVQNKSKLATGKLDLEVKDGKEKPKVLTPEEAIKLMSKENVTVQFKVASVEQTGWYFGYPATYYVYLKDGGKFTARLISNGVASPKEDQILKIIDKLGIKTVDDFKGKLVRVTGRVEHDSSNEAFVMYVHYPADIELVEEKPSEKQPMPKEEPAPKSAEQERKVLTPEEAMKQMPKEIVTVQFRVASVQRPDPKAYAYYYPFINYIQLRDGGGRFTANLFDKALAVERSGDLTGKMVRVTGRVEPAGDTLFRMVVRDANNIEVVKE